MPRKTYNDRIPIELREQVLAAKEILERELKREVKYIEAYRALTGIIKKNFQKEMKKKLKDATFK